MTLKNISCFTYINQYYHTIPCYSVHHELHFFKNIFNLFEKRSSPHSFNITSQVSSYIFLLFYFNLFALCTQITPTCLFLFGLYHLFQTISFVRHSVLHSVTQLYLHSIFLNYSFVQTTTLFYYICKLFSLPSYKWFTPNFLVKC